MWSKIKALLSSEDPEIAAAKVRMVADQKQDPRRHYIFGLLAMSQRADPAYLPELAQMAVREWYGLSSAEQLKKRIAAYVAGTGSTPAYDAFRAIFLARAGQGAGLLDEEESWDWAFRAARKVQQAYRSWASYGAGYIEGHLAYRNSQGDAAETIAQYRKNLEEKCAGPLQEIWQGSSFALPL